MKIENNDENRMWKDAPAALCEFVGIDPARRLAQVERERDEAIAARKASAADWLGQIDQANARVSQALQQVALAERERDEARDLAGLYRDQYWACAAPTSVEPPKFSWEAGK